MIQRAAAFTVEEVVSATSGQVLGAPHAPLAGVATDTRDALGGQLFVALRGARFDAHDFLQQAADAGASALLVEQGRVDAARLAGLTSRVGVVAVADTLRALGELGRFHRRRVAPRHVLALTGSNGKTSTKELLASVMGTRFRTRRTHGNLNNLIGLPLTLLSLEPGDEAAVLELGMNARGEIARMTELSEPDLGLVINVGPAHIGELGSIEEIARAKGELFDGLRPDALAVVNLDDARVREASRVCVRVRGFGRDPAADVRVLETGPEGEGQRVVLAVDGVEVPAWVPYPGAHNALNAAAAVAAATGAASFSPEQLIQGLGSAPRVSGRLVERSLGGYRVIDDAYNANGASMIAALETVRERAGQGRFVVLLGEMRELGDFAPAEHARVGARAAEVGAALVAAFGPDAAPIAEAAASRGVPAHHESSDAEALWRWLAPRLAPGDVVLVKGSRGIRMERFFDHFAALGGGEG